MIDRTTKTRWRRRFRFRKRQVERMGTQAEEQIERHFFKRLSRLGGVRRFILSWLVLVVILIALVVAQLRALSPYYQQTVPVSGGTYTEGIIGSFTNANPLYAVGSVDSAVSQLVFEGLLKYDQNNVLVGNLAQNWQLDEREVTYTVTLRPDLKWQDGTPLTADDVAFTYATIQNADAASPLLTSWQKIKIEAKDPRTVVFTLPSPLSAFPNSLTNGIVPKHLLGNIPVNQLRSARFNTVAPIGSGPFKWERIEVEGSGPDTRSEQIGLVPNPYYHGGTAKLQRYIIRTFNDEKRMIQSFKDRQLTAMAGLETVPDDVKIEGGVQQYNIPLTGQVTVFLKTSNEILASVKVRQALVQAADPSDIVRSINYPLVISKGPFLASHVGYNKDIVQLPTNIEQAKKLLDEDGWVPGANGIREKDKKPLTFHIYSQSTSEYALVTQKLQMQWRAIGVDIQVSLQGDADFKSTVANHNYDALLYGVSLGNDPDVYAYWHSSQGDIRSANRLNFSEYKSTVADKALEAGRSRSDPALRTVKYKPFLEAWRNDAPALVLYQPRFLYITRGTVYGFKPEALNGATERFSNVENWMIRVGKTDKP